MMRIRRFTNLFISNQKIHLSVFNRVVPLKIRAEPEPPDKFTSRVSFSYTNDKNCPLFSCDAYEKDYPMSILKKNPLSKWNTNIPTSSPYVLQIHFEDATHDTLGVEPFETCLLDYFIQKCHKTSPKSFHEWFSLIEQDLFLFIRQTSMGLRFLYSYNITHSNLNDGIYITSSHTAKLGNMLCLQNNVHQRIQQDLWDLRNQIVEVLNIPGHPISLGVIGSLGNFIHILSSSGSVSFDDARIILDNPLFYNTLEGLNLHEKLHTAIFDKKVYGLVQVDHVIRSRSAGYYPMLMSWVQKTNNSLLDGVRTSGYVTRCDVIRHLRNTLEHNTNLPGRFLTYQRFQKEFGNVVGELKEALEQMLRVDPRFNAHEVSILLAYFDSSKARNEDAEVTPLLTR